MPAGALDCPFLQNDLTGSGAHLIPVPSVPEAVSSGGGGEAVGS